MLVLVTFVFTGSAFEWEVNPVDDCFEGGLGMTGAGGPITEVEETLFERLENELNCDEKEDDVENAAVWDDSPEPASAKSELRAAYLSSGTWFGT